MATYSFLDTFASIYGPGGAVNLASGAGVAEEGITVEAEGDIDTQTIGADGEVMHSLHANKSGSVTLRLLKTSPINSMLSIMYATQTATSLLHGRNLITITNAITGDNIVCRDVAFKKAPSITYAKEAGMNEWTFNVGKIDRLLGVSV
jgi:hypothetical protein